jgi:hypothetical protein
MHNLFLGFQLVPATRVSAVVMGNAFHLYLVAISLLTVVMAWMSKAVHAQTT